jgi:hypothetical protein
MEVFMGYIYKCIYKASLLFLISLAILVASCRNPASGGPPKAPAGPDKTDLLKIIDQAEDLLESLAGSDDGGANVSQDKDWVGSGLKWKLEYTIETANIVFKDPKATAEDIQLALDELTKVYNEVNTAKKPGKIGKTDYSRLSALITNAQNLLSELNGYEESEDGKKVYTDTYWISPAQKQALADAISEAQEAQRIAAANQSTQDAVDEAITALEAVYNFVNGNAGRKGTFVADKSALPAKIAEAKEKIGGVKTSANGNDIPKYETWVTPALFNNLQTAITAADALIIDPYARQSAIDAAVKALESAITAFNPQIGFKPFDRSQLDALIQDAQNFLVELQGLQESVDGADVYEDTYWISADQKLALANAISMAQITADNEFVTPDEARQALDALSDVYNAAWYAKKHGTFTADKTNLQAQIELAYQKMTGIFISKDGFDILTSYKWVTQEMMTALDDALIRAKNLNGEPYARQEAVDAKAQNLYAAIAAFTPRDGLLIPGLVKITFVGPSDETITLTGDKALSWADNTPLIVTVAEEFNSYQWYIDGVIKAGETGKSISLNARSFSIGAHTLTLKVMKGSVPYTKTLTFTVN